MRFRAISVPWTSDLTFHLHLVSAVRDGSDATRYIPADVKEFFMMLTLS